MGFWLSVSKYLRFLHHFTDVLRLFGGEFDMHRCEVLLDIFVGYGPENVYQQPLDNQKFKTNTSTK